MAKAFPRSQFVGYDFHLGSIKDARAHAKAHGVSRGARFEVGLAKDYPGNDYDLVTCFDCLHDMGDPVGAPAGVRGGGPPGEQGELGDGGMPNGNENVVGYEPAAASITKARGRPLQHSSVLHEFAHRGVLS
jgi:hypothetical protein